MLTVLMGQCVQIIIKNDRYKSYQQVVLIVKIVIILTYCLLKLLYFSD